MADSIDPADPSGTIAVGMPGAITSAMYDGTVRAVVLALLLVNVVRS
jgi:hypothetical protein